MTAAFGLQLLKDGPGGTAAVLIPIAVAIGLAGAAFYALSRIGPLMLTVLSPARSCSS